MFINVWDFLLEKKTPPTSPTEIWTELYVTRTHPNEWINFILTNIFFSPNSILISVNYITLAPRTLTSIYFYCVKVK